MMDGEEVVEVPIPQRPKCLFPGCIRDAYYRGLCKGHYQTAARLVRQKKTSWAKLENEGKVGPYKGGGATNPTARWFLEGVTIDGKAGEASAEGAPHAEPVPSPAVPSRPPTRRRP